MELRGFPYFPPLYKFLDSQFDSRAWKKVFTLYEKKKYKESFLQLLKFADSKILKKYKVSSNTYRIPHGSIFVDIELSDTEILISSDIVRIPETGRVPLYRKVSELNFSGLNLPQMKTHEGLLYIEYNCSLDAYEPYKLYEAISDICYFGDQYDDELVSNFGAISLHEGDIKTISDSKKQDTWKNLQEVVQYSLSTIEELEKQRKNRLIWDVLSTTFKMIDSSFAPQGTTTLNIRKNLNKLYSQRESFTNIIYEGKEFLFSFQKMEAKDFMQDLYGINIFIPHKQILSDKGVADKLALGYSDAYNLWKSGNSEDSYFMLMHILYNVLYNNMMTKGMEKTIRKCLKKHAKVQINNTTTKKLISDISKIINLQGIEKNTSGIWSILALLLLLLGIGIN